MAENPYLESVRQTLPRLLSLFDGDRTSLSHGMGDRYHWAWGLIDFGNATFQGAAHGMARLWCRGLWPYACEREHFLDRIDALFKGAQHLTRKDGSLEEAFPNEGSFCVTALVAFDLLCALELLQAHAQSETRARWQSIIEPMVGYLLIADEAHAFISNHLATGAAALLRWHALSGHTDSETKARLLVDRILAHQSGEGWFKEYDGADPGYQSLATYYLADIHLRRPDWGLIDSLARSVRFLWHFAHPDGSFGGVYGSRCTRFYYPAGLEALAAEIPEAATLAEHMAASIDANRVVSLSCMDEPNLVPMFNAYCWAADLRASRSAALNRLVLPALRKEPTRLGFADAGLWLDAGPSHYTVINTHKGGVVAHFRGGQLALQDAGVVVQSPRGAQGSTQFYGSENQVRFEGDTLVIEAPIRPMPKRLPTPLQFIALRLMCLTIFRARCAREWVKRRLVGMLISRQGRWPASNVRRIRLGQDLVIADETTLARGYVRVDSPGNFVAIHMASQGYWQIQDEARP